MFSTGNKFFCKTPEEQNKLNDIDAKVDGINLTLKHLIERVIEHKVYDTTLLQVYDTIMSKKKYEDLLPYEI